MDHSPGLCLSLRNFPFKVKASCFISTTNIIQKWFKYYFQFSCSFWPLSWFGLTYTGKHFTYKRLTDVLLPEISHNPSCIWRNNHQHFWNRPEMLTPCIIFRMVGFTAHGACLIPDCGSPHQKMSDSSSVSFAGLMSWFLFLFLVAVF